MAEVGKNPHELAFHSTFCFQPTGDLPTRKGFFDAISMGCIPVTFDDLTAAVMYTWHWSENFWRSVSIAFDFAMVATRQVDPILSLIEISKNESFVREVQLRLFHHAFELQYSLDGLHECGVNCTWPQFEGKPMRDAYEISMDHVLGWHSGKESDVRQGTVPECWDGKGFVNRCVIE